VWIGDKDEGFEGNAGLADQWDFNTVGPICQWKQVVVERVWKVDVIILATTPIQAVLLCKHASKPSDPLDRDPTVSHI
jgi:hypothetical protein